MTDPTTSSSTRKVCDGASVGVVIQTEDGVLIGDRTDGAGAAGIAGHVFDAHSSYDDAARAEVEEEAGLTVVLLEQVTDGWVWRPNRCKRGDGPHGSGHRWQIYRASVTGQMTIDPGSFSNVRWATRSELQELAERTLNRARGQLTVQDWTARPGIEPVWVQWFAIVELIDMRPEDLDVIEQFISGRAGR
ncbi:NUDIX domain-containing protein [Spirillospora sp. CA-108201]